MAKLTDQQRREKRVLRALADTGGDFGYLAFKAISRRARLPRNQVRLAARSLARKGLAEYGRGLWSEDGTPGGSGYCIIKAGRAALANGAP